MNSWHVTYSYKGSTYSADFKIVSGQNETEEQMRLILSRKNPTWEVTSVELRNSMPPDDPGPQGAPGWSSGE